MILATSLNVLNAGMAIISLQIIINIIVNAINVQFSDAKLVKGIMNMIIHVLNVIVNMLLI